MSTKLKDYCQLAKDDFSAIVAWARDNHFESRLLELIPRLANSQMNRVERELDYMKTWSANTVNMYEVPGVSQEAAKHLNYLFQCVIANQEPCSQTMDWLHENIPQMEIPTLCFVPAVAWLAERGIRFKGDSGKFRDWEKRPDFDSAAGGVLGYGL